MLKLFSSSSRKKPTTANIAPNSSSSAAGVNESQADAPRLQETSSNAASQRQVIPANYVLKLRVVCCYLPHPDKAHYGGEDAYFISDMAGGAFGIADGVGGWQDSGVNPAEYSRTLMRVACSYVEGTGSFVDESGCPRPSPIDPRGVLNAAHQLTKVPGSATAVAVQLDQQTGNLVAANLGDSGFMVVRGGQLLLRSRPLQHYFDCPLQFGAYPEYVEATDTADQADLYSLAVEPGDMIVAGTDGLWDNVYEADIVGTLNANSNGLQHTADTLAMTARRHAADPNYPSPYSKEALAQGFDLPWWEKLFGASFKNGRFTLKQLTGGKMDDITVVVGMVEAVAPTPEPRRTKGWEDRDGPK